MTFNFQTELKIIDFLTVLTFPIIFSSFIECRPSWWAGGAVFPSVFIFVRSNGALFTLRWARLFARRTVYLFN